MMLAYFQLFSSLACHKDSYKNLSTQWGAWCTVGAFTILAFSENEHIT